MDIIIYLFLGNLICAFIPKRYRVQTDCLYVLPLVMGGIALAGAIVKGVQAAKENSLANGINPDDPTYQVSQYAKNNLGLANSLFNGRMAGATDLQRNIQGTQANTLGSIERNATNSSQALALAAGAQGQTNNSLQQLQIQEAQNKQGLAGAVYNANRDLTNENDKVYQDQVRKYQQDVQAKSALRQAAAQNLGGLFNDLSSGAMIAGSMGGFGGAAQQMTDPTRSLNPANVGGYGFPITPALGLMQYNQPGATINGQIAPNGMLFNPLNWKR